MSKTMIDLTRDYPRLRAELAALRVAGHTTVAASSVKLLTILSPMQQLTLLLDSGVLPDKVVRAAWDHLSDVGEKLGLAREELNDPPLYVFYMLACRTATALKCEFRNAVGIQRAVELADAFTCLASSLSGHFIDLVVCEICYHMKRIDNV